MKNLDRLTSLAAARGVRAVLHPHVGTMIERRLPAHAAGRDRVTALR